MLDRRKYIFDKYQKHLMHFNQFEKGFRFWILNFNNGFGLSICETINNDVNDNRRPGFNKEQLFDVSVVSIQDDKWCLAGGSQMYQWITIEQLDRIVNKVSNKDYVYTTECYL